MEQGNIIERQWNTEEEESNAEIPPKKNTHISPEQPRQELKATSFIRPENLSPLSKISKKETKQHNKKHHFAHRPFIWAVGGGKGGVGKSLLAANYAIRLSQLGYKVLAIDLDLGGSNLHTCLGVKPPKHGLGDWAQGIEDNIEAVAVDSSFNNLRVISGASDTTKINELVLQKKHELLAELRSLDYDHIIFDLGAGTLDVTTDLFGVADQGIISILPEPTSVENAYRFIRNVLYNGIKNLDLPDKVMQIVEVASDQKNALGIKTPMDLVAVVKRMDADSAKMIQNCVSAFSPSIVMNQVRSQVDIDVGHAIKSVCGRFFSIQAHYAGYIDYDNSVWKSVREKKAVLSLYPRSTLASRIYRIADTLLEKASDS